MSCFDLYLVDGGGHCWSMTNDPGTCDRARDRRARGASMSTGFIPLSDPHVTAAEIEAVTAVLHSPRLSAGPAVKAFEDAFAAYTGRKHAIAVSSGTAGLLLVLKAYGIGPGDEVIASAYSWHETAHAIALSGATPVFADIDYWAGTLAPEKAEARIGEKTRAIVAGNTNGHPAPWDAFRELAQQRGLVLIEDSTEAIGSVYQGKAGWQLRRLRRVRLLAARRHHLRRRWHDRHRQRGHRLRDPPASRAHSGGARRRFR